MPVDSNDLLQHPRRNLGNRYRSQAQKFSRLATIDQSRFNQNMAWAEQSARQAVLYDFTDEENWRCLVNIKIILGDSDGLRAVLEDVFSILGRDPENIKQLSTVDFMKLGLEMLDATFSRDPLNPDAWWEMISSGENWETDLQSFVIRCNNLDFSDQRANIVFGRRIERIRDAGHIRLFIELAKILLAHRPQNHELWMELGRLYERLVEYDGAWICYDHVQTLRPHISPRDDFMERVRSKMDGLNKPHIWTTPSVSKRQDFTDKMLKLANRISSADAPLHSEANVIESSTNLEEQNLAELITRKKFSEAFFMARRLLATGEEWASAYLEQAKDGLQ